MNNFQKFWVKEFFKYRRFDLTLKLLFLREQFFLEQVHQKYQIYCYATVILQKLLKTYKVILWVSLQI